jgi:hypothetical protein
MKYYIIVTVSSLPNDSDGDEDTDEVLTALDILSNEGQPLLFVNQHDAEDFMDVADVDVEMVVIEAPESLTDGIIVA